MKIKPLRASLVHALFHRHVSRTHALPPGSELQAPTSQGSTLITGEERSSPCRAGFSLYSRDKESLRGTAREQLGYSGRKQDTCVSSLLQ